MFADSFKRLAKSNADFRRVLYTGSRSQVVAMSIPPGQDIGEETHPTTDQIFLIADGEGEATIGGEVRRFEENGLIFVPAGTLHNIRNTNDEDLKLLTIYAPSEHAEGEVQAKKAL